MGETMCFIGVIKLYFLSVIFFFSFSYTLFHEFVPNSTTTKQHFQLL